MSGYVETPGHNALHLWFDLSYASYLVLPRVLMNSMPERMAGTNGGTTGRG